MDGCWTKEDVYLLRVHYTPEDIDVIFDGGKTFIKNALAKEMAPYVRGAAEEEVYEQLDDLSAAADATSLAIFYD